MIKSLRKFESLTCILVNFLFLGACTQNAEQGSVEPVVSLGEVPLTQLPADVRPLSYNLQLKINPDEDYFEGVAQIRIELDKPRDGIWLHGVDLDITEGSLHRQGSPAWELTPEQVNDAGVLRIDFPEALSAGLALLEFKYRARYNISDEGLSKVEEGGNAYVFSQLEATSARMVFPSFDEPRFKTAFDIKVDIAADHVAISNAPEKSVETVSNGWKRVTFATTRLLPTYLIALAVGPFDVVQAPDIRQSKIRQETIPLRGIAVKGKGDQLKFALAHTEELLLALEQYFDYPYPYAKLDLIAVPSKGSSAMENAGAITYGEQLLLLDDTATVEQTRGYYSVHAHELAHQWFGNLVTPRWWNDIWLTEAFATWIAAKILDRLYPGEHYLDDQAASTAAVMNQDGLVTARKIRQPILDHGDINAAFDGITYVKGGGVLRMFESFLGEDEFREGLRHYMDKHAWGNTDANDFMKAISEVNSHVDSAELISSFNSYIDQPGVPIVNVNLNCAEDRNNLAISQKRYFPVGSSGVTDQKWDIPICIKYRVDGVLK
jgi:alanyl aminopeptidase